MKKTSRTANAALSAFAIMSASTLSGVAGTEVVAPAPVAEQGGSIFDSIHLFGTARLRYEVADIDGYDYADVASIRARLGVKTDSIGGFKFLAEGEYTTPLTESDGYSAFPAAAGPGVPAVIADPDNFELNRLQLSYAAEAINTTITVGRQYINFADQRFVGAIGWRQNDQTFDAVVIENNSFENLNFTYAYVDQVNRIFGDRTGARPSALDRFEGESHLVHVEYTGIADHTVRAFAYLLDFDNAPGASTDTYGLELQGQSGNINYLVTAALQSDAGSNTADYDEYYFRGQVGSKTDCCDYGAGVEMMTSNGTNSFQFPIGTNHKFNGFADAFLGTPGNGLIDYYAWVGTKALGFKHKLALHSFHSETGGEEFGYEIDYVAARKIGDNAKFVLKAAYLDGKDGNSDRTRASAEINYTF